MSFLISFPFLWCSNPISSGGLWLNAVVFIYTLSNIPNGQTLVHSSAWRSVFARVWLSIKCFPKAIGITYILQLIPVKNCSPMKSGNEIYSLAFLERCVLLSGLISLLYFLVILRTEIVWVSQWEISSFLCLETFALRAVFYVFSVWMKSEKCARETEMWHLLKVENHYLGQYSTNRD